MPLDIPCPACGKLPPPPCGCALPPGPEEPTPASPAPKPKKLYPETLKLRRERRNGRDVIVVEGFNAGTQVDFQDLAQYLRRSCGTGGTVKGRMIEIQGDHRDQIAAILLERGFRSKRAGG